MVPALHLLWANNFNKCKAHLKQTSKLLMKTLFKSCHRWQMSQRVMERFVSVNGATSKADTSPCPTRLAVTQSEPIRAFYIREGTSWLKLETEGKWGLRDCLGGFNGSKVESSCDVEGLTVLGHWTPLSFYLCYYHGDNILLARFTCMKLSPKIFLSGCYWMTCL